MIMNADGTYGKYHRLNNISNSKENYKEAEYYVNKLASLDFFPNAESKAISYLSQSNLNNSDKDTLIKLIKHGKYDNASVAMAKIDNNA